MKTLLSEAEEKRIFTLFEEAGFDIRFVGGCVRDALMNRTLGDKDLATTATPEQGMALLQKNAVTVIPTGIDHGTITAVINKKSFEITTLRRDVETDGRHAKVQFGTDWIADAERRDFTINAMSVDSKGVLSDYFDGQKDIQFKTLRFIGDPEKRMQEDYLRILRYFRFASVFDWELHDPVPLELCRKHAPSLKNLSRERIQNELYKLLAGPGALRLAEQMSDLSVWQALIGKTVATAFLKNCLALEETPDSFRRLVSLVNAYDDLEGLVVLTNAQKKRLNTLQNLNTNWPLQKQLYFFGSEAVLDHQILSGNKEHLKTIKHWDRPVFPLRAEDIMDRTGGPGPKVGQILKAAEEYWVDQEFKPSKTDLLALPLLF